jgi:hypothetical protein
MSTKSPLNLTAFYISVLLGRIAFNEADTFNGNTDVMRTVGRLRLGSLNFGSTLAGRSREGDDRGMDLRPGEQQGLFESG